MGLVVLGTGCIGDERVQVGAEDDPPTGWVPAPEPDMATSPGHDMAHHGGSVDMAHGTTSNPDMAMPVTGTTCASGMVDCGAITTMSSGSAKHFTDNFTYDFYVCRDSGGLFAMDASCPHAGCTVDQQGSGFYCPCHGATFAFDGSKPTSPASRSLKHYVICIDTATNHVHVNTSTTASSATRY
jgi:nitrite reductase/ring-hydroxylating ferredoxin subunit